MKWWTFFHSIIFVTDLLLFQNFLRSIGLLAWRSMLFLKTQHEMCLNTFWLLHLRNYLIAKLLWSHTFSEYTSIKLLWKFKAFSWFFFHFYLHRKSHTLQPPHRYLQFSRLSWYLSWTWLPKRKVYIFAGLPVKMCKMHEYWCKYDWAVWRLANVTHPFSSLAFVEVLLAVSIITFHQLQ